MKRRIVAYTDDEWEDLNVEIHGKASRGEKLNPIELDFFCQSMSPNDKLKFPLCKEYLFRDLYFRGRRLKHTPEHYKLDQHQKEMLDNLADEWLEDVVLVSKHSSQTLQYISKETRDELKKVKKEFSYNGFLVRSFLYEEKVKRTIWMSRYIHFKIVYDFFLVTLVEK